MRTAVVGLFLLAVPLCSAGQAAGDTLVIGNSTVARDNGSALADSKFTLSKGDRVILREVGGTHYKISHDGREGWVSQRATLSEEVVEQNRRLRRERANYVAKLQERGYTLFLLEQDLSVNSADGISVEIRLANISESKTIKYARIQWKLYNPVGDPIAGGNGTPSLATTEFVGPLKPGKTGEVEFENVWYSSVGRCATIQQIEVEHIDGSTFTYINDLEEIDEYAEGVRLEGDCSYEAQQNEG